MGARHYFWLSMVTKQQLKGDSLTNKEKPMIPTFWFSVPKILLQINARRIARAHHEFRVAVHFGLCIVSRRSHQDDDRPSCRPTHCQMSLFASIVRKLTKEGQSLFMIP